MTTAATAAGLAAAVTVFSTATTSELFSASRGRLHSVKSLPYPIRSVGGVHLPSLGREILGG